MVFFNFLKVLIDMVGCARALSPRVRGIGNASKCYGVWGVLEPALGCVVAAMAREGARWRRSEFKRKVVL